MTFSNNLQRTGMSSLFKVDRKTCNEQGEVSFTFRFGAFHVILLSCNNFSMSVSKTQQKVSLNQLSFSTFLLSLPIYRN